MKKFAVILGALLSIIPAHAQKYTLSAGLAVPSGSFGEKSNTLYGIAALSPSEKGGSKGEAGNGFFIDFQVSKELRDHLELYSGISVICNGVSTAIDNDSLFAKVYTEGIYLYDQVTVSYPLYFNVPWITGLSYSCPIGKSVSVFANAGIGVNTRIITDYSFEYVYQGTKGENRWDYSKRLTLAGQVSLGACFFDHYRLSASYYNLGQAKVISSVTETLGSSSPTYDHESDVMKTGMLTVSLGYTF